MELELLAALRARVGRYAHFAVGLKTTGTKINPGKWEHGPKLAVGPSDRLFLSHCHFQAAAVASLEVMRLVPMQRSKSSFLLKPPRFLPARPRKREVKRPVEFQPFLGWNWDPGIFFWFWPG